MAMLNNQRVDYNDVTATSLEIVKKSISVENTRSGSATNGEAQAQDGDYMGGRGGLFIVGGRGKRSEEYVTRASAPCAWSGIGGGRTISWASHSPQCWTWTELASEWYAIVSCWAPLSADPIHSASGGSWTGCWDASSTWPSSNSTSTFFLGSLGPRPLWLLKVEVGLQGVCHIPAQLSVHRWTSTRDLPSSVCTAGPQPGTCPAQCAPLDLNGQIDS